MKKSELKNYIRENILSTLSESEESVKDLQDKKNARAEYNAELAKTSQLKKDVGIEEAYGSRMPSQAQVDKFFALTQNEMHYLNSKPVRGQEKTFNNMEVEPWDEYDLSNWNALVRKAKQRGKSINENEDAEPTKKDIKKTKGLAKAKEELALLTREMKSLAKKYSKAEGEEKEKLVKTLKAKTKLKKELESILDKKKI